MPEFAWLIETKTEPVLYWGGSHGWTADHTTEAVRFARECDAESAAIALDVAGAVRVREHGWG